MQRQQARAQRVYMRSVVAAAQLGCQHTARALWGSLLDDYCQVHLSSSSPNPVIYCYVQSDAQEVLTQSFAIQQCATVVATLHKNFVNTPIMLNSAQTATGSTRQTKC